MSSGPRGSWPDFLDLPWDEPLEGWTSPRIVEVARGISRHGVRFGDYDGALYALKELPERPAHREWKLLRANISENTYLLDADVFADGRYFFKVIASDRPSNPADQARQLVRHFELEPGDLGTFGRGRAASVVWLGLRAGQEAATTLGASADRPAAARISPRLTRRVSCRAPGGKIRSSRASAGASWAATAAARRPSSGC